MNNYLKYLYTYVFSKWPLLIILFVGIAGFFGLNAANINFMNKTGAKGITVISSMNYIMPFLVSTLFSVFVYAYVFKDGEKDGSELIILTKPITRGQIFLSKAIVLLTFITMYALLYLFAGFAVGAMDKKATGDDLVRFAFSMALGIFAVQLIFGPIIMLIGTLVSKIGVIVISILIAAIFPIVSLVLGALSKGTPSLYTFDFYKSGFEQVQTEQYNYLNLSDLDVTKENYGFDNNALKASEASKLLLREQYSFDAQGNFIVDNNQNNSTSKTPIETMDEYFKTMWYGAIAPIDIWYHWSRFYSMFIEAESPFVQGALVEPTRLVKSDKKVSYPEGSGIKIINGNVIEEYIFNYPTSNLNSLETFYLEKEIKTFTWDKGLINQRNNSYVGKEFTEFVINDFMELMRPEIDPITGQELKDENNQPIIRRTNFEKFVEEKYLINRLWALSNLYQNFEQNNYNGSTLIIDKWQSNFSNHLRNAKNNEPGQTWKLDSFVFTYKLIEKAMFTIPEHYPSSIRSQTNQEKNKPDGPQMTSTVFDVRFVKNGAPLDSLYSKNDPSSNFTYVIETKPFLSTTLVIIIWLVLGVLFMGLAFWRYTKIDFK